VCSSRGTVNQKNGTYPIHNSVSITRRDIKEEERRTDNASTSSTRSEAVHEEVKLRKECELVSKIIWQLAASPLHSHLCNGIHLCTRPQRGSQKFSMGGGVLSRDRDVEGVRCGEIGLGRVPCRLPRKKLY